MESKLNLLAESLVKEGVQWAFGVTGSGPSLELISLLEEKGISYVPASHEASAALMAGAVARVTGDPAVAISIKGPGLANMIPGIAANYFECAPVISISEAFNEDFPLSRQHKRLPQKALVQPLVKARISLNHVEKEFHRFVSAARKEVQGPVHVDLCDESRREGVWYRKNKAGRFSRAGLLEKTLSRSVKPVVIAGSLARRRGWGQKLASLRVPIFTTVAAKGFLDERLPYSAGIYTGTGKELAPETKLLSQADMIIGLGLRSNEVIQAQKFEKPIILFDDVISDFSKGFSSQSCFDASQPKTLRKLWMWLSGLEWGKDAVRQCLEEMNTALLQPSWLPARCFTTLNRLEGAYGLVLDTGSFCTIGEHVWQATAGREYVGSSNGRFMGTAIPTAIGFSLARKNFPVFCISGDGGFRLYPSDIKIAAEKKTPICFIVMVDGYYGSIACVQQKRPMSKTAVKLLQPMWAQIVEGMGIESVSVFSEDQFKTAVENWDRKSPKFIEAVFESESYAQMTARLR